MFVCEVTCRGHTVICFSVLLPLKHLLPTCSIPVLHSSHPSPVSILLLCFAVVKGCPSCIRHHFFGILLIFICSVWFCIVCLSPVSRQWFYPMVGDIMLFYHRVEPRTGCWRVSASVRQSIPSSHKPLGWGAAGVLGSAWFWCCSRWWCFWWELILSNMHLFVCYFNSDNVCLSLTVCGVFM